MNSLRKLLLIIPVSLVMSNIMQAQEVTVIKDSLALKEKKEQKSETKTQTQSNENKSGNNTNTGVKQVRSARPDMSKAKGARPPSIVRPSGSRIPKGIGKPGGAGGPGRR